LRQNEEVDLKIIGKALIKPTTIADKTNHHPDTLTGE